MESVNLLLAVLAAAAAAAPGYAFATGGAPARRRGEELYGRMCAVCHGPAGEGNAADRAPAIGHSDFLASADDLFLRRAILDGRPGTTMSAWSQERGGPLSSEDADAVVSYLRARPGRPPAARPAERGGGSVSRGRSAFQTLCARCHGATGAEGPDVHIGEPEFLRAASNAFLRAAIVRGREGTTMPAFGETGAEDLIAFLRSRQSALSSRPPAALPLRRPPPIALGPVPLNPRGPEPVGFKASPAFTPAAVVKSELDRGARMALLDARAPTDYAHEHISDAVSVPFYDPGPYLKGLPKDAWLVCYCACPHAESGQLAQRLSAKGFAKVTVLDEGFTVWKARKYGTRSGREP